MSDFAANRKLWHDCDVGKLSLQYVGMQKPLKNYAFIDSQNVNLTIRNLGWSLDWRRFRVYLTEHYGVKKAYLFLGYLPHNNELYESLQSAGFIIIFKPVLESADGCVKGNCDAELVLHTMIEWDAYEKAVIVSGDGDFYCLVDHLHKNDKLAILLVPNQFRYSALFKKTAREKIAFMNNLREKLAYHKREKLAYHKKEKNPPRTEP